MPLSWRFHGAFMAALKTLLQTLSCHFHGTFSEHYGKILIYHFLCLSVCLSSVCFFLLLIFSLMVCQVDQRFSFFSLIKI